MKSISLICVYNNQELLDTMVNSCKNQTVGFENIEFILIDNTAGAFSSAAAALNYGTKKATTDTWVFLHQDIEFLKEDGLEYIINYLNNNPEVLVGAAGVKSRKKDYNGIVSSMYSGIYKAKYSDEQNPQEVFVLDECLFACRKELFGKICFDEIICDGWHLYAADLCLQAKLNGYSVVVLPLSQVWHKSWGNADKEYFRTQNVLARKYKKHYEIINTTNSWTYTNPMKRMLLNSYRKLRYGK